MATLPDLTASATTTAPATGAPASTSRVATTPLATDPLAIDPLATDPPWAGQAGIGPGGRPPASRRWCSSRCRRYGPRGRWPRCASRPAVLASYALTGGRTWRAPGGLALIPAASRCRLGRDGGRFGAGWVGARLAASGRPVVAGLAAGWCSSRFGALLPGADPVFADLIDSLAQRNLRVDIIRAARGSRWWPRRPRRGATSDRAGRTHRRRSAPAPAHGPRGLSEWVIPLAMLDALFARLRVGAAHRPVRRQRLRARRRRARLRRLRPRRLRPARRRHRC